MEFQLLKNRKPEYAEALGNHLRQHKQIVAMQEQQRMMAQMGGGMIG